MDFSTFPDRGELLADTRFTPTLFGEGLGPFDLREFAISIFPWDALWIFRVSKPVNVGEHIRFTVASLRNKGDIAYLGQTTMFAISEPDCVNLVEWNQKVCVPQRLPTEIIAGVRSQSPVDGKAALQCFSISLQSDHRSRSGDPIRVAEIRMRVGVSLRHSLASLKPDNAVLDI